MSDDDVLEELLTAFRDETAEALDAMLRLRDGWASVDDADAAVTAGRWPAGENGLPRCPVGDGPPHSRPMCLSFPVSCRR